MTYVVASLLLLLAAPFVLWPLIRHWQPAPEPPAAAALDARERRRGELEELDLDVAAGRISEREAAARRSELG
jgi:cytochrome c-type biogenesis protein CcmI